jgi:hypothetical protein
MYGAGLPTHIHKYFDGFATNPVVMQPPDSLQVICILWRFAMH